MLNNNVMKLTISSLFPRIMGFLLINLSILPLPYFLGNYQITCNDIKPNLARECLLNFSFFGISKKQTNLNTLIGAAIIGTSTYSIMLKTTDGLINMTQDSSVGYAKKEKIVDTINQFIATGTHNSVKLANPNPWWLSLISLLFTVVGLYIMLFSSGYELIFDKTNNRLQYMTKNITGNKNLSFVLSDVSKINVESNISNRRDGSRTFRLVILMKDGQTYPITSYFTSGAYQKRKIAKKINTFLNIAS
ncbi:hypothetical protein [Legionella gresilensis]|uniref:hypothetical protein n=1 Tax=Legionella gresilensis TaxID=91823 RepID=UPI0010417DE2|nr:hypothetical protein [Legionella gresilensis]